jgi:hypothetical protein
MEKIPALAETAEMLQRQRERAGKTKKNLRQREQSPGSKISKQVE